jgi:prevent-host-death family protein
MRRLATGTVPATEFKAKCLELMDRVAEGRETYVITKRGKPVARLVPADGPRKTSVFGCMADQTEAVGPLATPLRGEDEWNALERQRAVQWKAWEREWRRRGTISGKKSVGQPPHLTKGKPGARPRSRRPKR